MATTLASGHTVEKISEEEIQRFARGRVLADGAVRLHPGNWFFSKSFLKYADAYYNFQVKPTDIFVIALPKSGTNWIQEIVWNLVHNPDLDHPEADVSLDFRCPFFGLDFLTDVSGGHSIDPNGELAKRCKELCPGKEISDGMFLNLATYSPDPRLLKTHLQYCLLSPETFTTSKVIYLARDPRDIMVSSYHFYKFFEMTKFTGTLEDIVDNHINERVVFGPYWEHVRLAWERRNDPNFLFVFYEDLKADQKSEIKRIDQFLETNRTDNQIDNVVRYTSFSSMKLKTVKNPPTSFENTFHDKEKQAGGASYFRKGKVGSWKDDFTPEIEEKVNAWMRENLTKFGDDFKYKNLIKN